MITPQTERNMFKTFLKHSSTVKILSFLLIAVLVLSVSVYGSEESETQPTPAAEENAGGSDIPSDPTDGGDSDGSDLDSDDPDPDDPGVDPSEEDEKPSDPAEDPDGESDPSEEFEQEEMPQEDKAEENKEESDPEEAAGEEDFEKEGQSDEIEEKGEEKDTDEKEDPDENFEDKETDWEDAEGLKTQEKEEQKTKTLLSNPVLIGTVPHDSLGYLLSAAKYSRFYGLTDFNFFTAQESGSYSAYTVSENMIAIGKYQFTDFGAQGNGTAAGLIAYMQAHCSEAVVDLYNALYTAYILDGKNAIEEWNACAQTDTQNFMTMQDAYAYEHYYLPGEATVESAGIRLRNRPWVVKGICFSMFICLGTAATYGTGAYAVITAGIENTDSDEVFIEKACRRMVELYAGEYYWMYGRFEDGSDTAMGVSDKDLALEILEGNLYEDPDVFTCRIQKAALTYEKTKDKAGRTVQSPRLQVQGRIAYKESDIAERVTLQYNRDYTVACKTVKNQMMFLEIKGKGRWQGCTILQTIPLRQAKVI